MADNSNGKAPDGSGVFYFRMNKGAKAWTKKYRTEIAAFSSSVLSTFAAFPLGPATESGLYIGSLLGLVSRLRHGARRADDNDEGR